jgi:hypothetical protein
MRSIITRNKQLQDKDNWNDSSLLINNEQLSQAPSTEESLATNQAFLTTNPMATLFSIEGRLPTLAWSLPC